MVRFAKEEDLFRVNELREEVNAVHVNGRPDIFKPGFNEELRNYINEIWDAENKNIIVAERDGIICGFACVRYIDKPESSYTKARKFYEVEEFGVDKVFRRQGVATELMEFIREDAKSRGMTKLELNMWEFNEGALAFYESVGFKTYRRYMELDVE